MPHDDSKRWLALAVFTLSTSLCFLDRQILSAVAPSISTDFALDNRSFSLLLSAFSLAYAISSPLAGWLIDRFGLTITSCVAVALWCLIGIATSYTTTFAGLMACRIALGIMESGSIPAAGKAVAIYLRPQERSLGTGFNQVAITIGATSASILAGALALQYGWRTVFLVAGILGLLWIPFWLTVSRQIPHEKPKTTRTETKGIYSDTRLWGLLAANMLAMTGYSLWMNWTTKFLVTTQNLSEKDANLGYAWMPSVLAAAGGITGGSIAYRLGKKATSLAQARIKTAWIGGIALLLTAAAPHAPNPLWATLIICWALFWTLVVSVNLYALPLDYFGPERAARATAALTLAFGLMQTALSYAIGWAVDISGYTWVCAIIAVLPLASCAILEATKKES